MGNSTSYNKTECIELAGDLFNEDLWSKYAKNEVITRNTLFMLKNTYSYSEKGASGGIIYKFETDKIVAQQGNDAIDASILSLTGEEKLLSDYYSSNNHDLPLILNVGSCT